MRFKNAGFLIEKPAFYARVYLFSMPASSASRRVLRLMLNGAIVGGVMLASWPLAQNVYARYNQNQLEKQWQAQNSGAKPAKKVALQTDKKSAKTNKSSQVSSSDDPTMGRKSRARAPQKWPLTKISIADIELETYAVQGWDEASLRRGPGHDPNSAMPGTGNCVLAGHRNIYGSYFYNVDRILPGAPIVLQSREGKFTYTTGRVFTTTDTDYSILAQPAPGEPPILTLITCTMPHTSNRIIVQAVLSSVE